jgi:hypothetical protein
MIKIFYKIVIVLKKISNDKYIHVGNATSLDTKPNHQNSPKNGTGNQNLK